MNLLGGTKNNSSELLKAQAHIWNHVFNYINSMSLKCAVELGIPDIIHSHGKPITISELNNALSVHPTKVHCLGRLMHLLVHLGFFELVNTDPEEAEEHQGYVLTNSSRLLLKDNPFTLTLMVLLNLSPDITNPWDFLSTWFLNGDPTPFGTTHHMELWDYVAHYPEINTLFNKTMSNDSRLISRVLISDGKAAFDGVNSVVDVGGGTGTFAKAIAEAFPQIQCTVLDLPHVVAGLNDTLNLKYVTGDMFESIPPADALLLKWILHDWKDEECLKILEQCKKAIKGRKGGKLIIIDMVRDYQKMDNEDIETQLLFDMLMMMFFNAKERKEKEWAKLFSDAGFSSYKIIPILGLRSVIEVYL